MDKFKEFVKKHQKEICIGAWIIFAYQVGFRKGCRASNQAVTNLFENAAKTMNLTKF